MSALDLEPDLQPAPPSRRVGAGVRRVVVFAHQRQRHVIAFRLDGHEVDESVRIGFGPPSFVK